MGYTYLLFKEPKSFIHKELFQLEHFFDGHQSDGILKERIIKIYKGNEGINALIIGIVSTIIFVRIFLITENIADKIPSALIPII